MPLILPGNVGSATAATGYDVANSCRFNPADSAFVHKTPDAGDRQKATFSCWIKRSLISSAQTLFWAGSDNSNYQTFPRFLANDKIVVAEINSGSTTWEIFTDRVFKDISAWYHIVVAMDTTQATAANRVKIYVNGVQETSLNIDGGYPAEDRNTLINTAVPHQIGHDYVAQYYGGYVAEACFIEGSQNAPTDFGEFDDSGIWKPIDVSGLTFGTNGFYLDFEASGNLGNDANGGTDLTESGLAATDQSTDTCTNNFATMNPLSSGMTLTEGNLNVANSGGKNAVSTFSVASGKWYVEMKATNAQTYNPIVGIATDNSTAVTNPASTDYPGNFAESHGYDRTGTITSSNATDQGSLTTSQSDNDIIGLAVDLDSGTKTAQWYVNGSSVGSAVTLVSSEFYVFMTYASGSQAGTGAWNFGSPSYANSSSVADGNGFGNFEYAPPSGYFALCTKNLAEYG